MKRGSGHKMTNAKNDPTYSNTSTKHRDGSFSVQLSEKQLPIKSQSWVFLRCQTEIVNH